MNLPKAAEIDNNAKRWCGRTQKMTRTVSERQPTQASRNTSQNAVVVGVSELFQLGAEADRAVGAKDTTSCKRSPYL